MSTSNKERNILILGMIFAEGTKPSLGQEYRDGIRCHQLQLQGYEVYTLDNKHTEDEGVSGKHCKANFADARRMVKSIRKQWGNISFHAIILDYFFCPEGWARTRWTDNFFRETIPCFVSEGLLMDGGKLWLPFLRCVEDSLTHFKDILQQCYNYILIADPLKNPLYLATEFVYSELRKCNGAVLDNTNQLLPLTNYSDTPFCVLSVKNKAEIQVKAVTAAATEVNLTPKKRSSSSFSMNSSISSSSSIGTLASSSKIFFGIDATSIDIRDIRMVKRQIVRDEQFFPVVKNQIISPRISKKRASKKLK